MWGGTRSLALEAPAGRAVRLLVATPITVWKVNRYTCHGGGPALGALNGAVNASPSTSAGGLLIGHPGRGAVEDEVDALQSDGDRAGRVGGQVATFAGSRAAGEVEVAVPPLRADTRGVRRTVWPAGSKEVRNLSGRPGGEHIAARLHSSAAFP